jgi:ATP-binding cassette subfamily B protein
VALKLIVDQLSRLPSAGFASLTFLIAIYVLCLWSAKTLGEARSLLYARAQRRTFRTISERLFEHIMHLPLRYHLERQTGAVSQTLDNGLEGVQLIMQHTIVTVLPVSAELVFEAFVLTRLVSPSFLILFCAAVACYGVIFWYSGATISSAARAASAARVHASAAMTDSLMNYEVVKYFAAEHLVQRRVCRELELCEATWVTFFRRYSINGLLVAFIFAGFLAASVVIAARQVRLGTMSLGSFVLVNTYMLQLAKPIEMLGYAAQGLVQGAALLDKLLRVFRETRELDQAKVRLHHNRTAALAFEKVTVAYRPGQPVLKGVSFRIDAGCTLGVVGPSGAGKSTLVRLLMRLLEPDSGRIILAGLPVAGLSLAELRNAIGVVPQDTVLLNDTLRYNISFGRHTASSAEIENAARAAHLHDFVMTLPDRYDTVVGERGIKLSGGERQRISIARAVLKEPQMYVFDEATSSLDSRTEGDILRNLKKVARSTTTLVIAHRLSTVIHADEIIVLERGELVERGDHRNLLRKGGTYAALWKAQREGTAAA